MKQELLRSKIDEQHKWDLKAMIKNQQEFEDYYKKVEILNETLQAMKGRILESADTLYQFLEKSIEQDRLLEHLYSYAHMDCDVDSTNGDKQALKLRAKNLNDMVNEALSFATPELMSKGYQVILDYIDENPSLEDYRFYMELLNRNEPYTLSECEEEIISKASSAFGTGLNAFYAFNNTDVKFEAIEVDGKLVPLTHGNFQNHIMSSDRNVRQQAFEHTFRYYQSHINTLASLLAGKVKENWFYSKARGYDSPLHQSLYQDNVDVSVYHHLIDTVHQYLPSMHEYVKIRKQILEVDELHMYDMYAKLSSFEQTDVAFEDASTLIEKGLKPLGTQYLNDASKALKERWIDVYPSKGKRSGAYSWGSYDSYPYLLLNYNGTTDAIMTYAHELGHSMHSYYSNTKQNYLYHAYPILLAEIASTVNEVLLNEYCYQHATTKEEKMYYIVELLEKIKGTIFRQTMFAEFEHAMHEKEYDGIALTEKEFCDTYYALNETYYGPHITHDDMIRYEWARIPHFYTSYYVYKYATGLSAALVIASEILKGNEQIKEAYLTFLSSGGSDYPLALLQKVGVDLKKPEVIHNALQVFEQKLEELKQLLEEK